MKVCGSRLPKCLKRILFIKRLGITCSNILAVGKSDGSKKQEEFSHVVKLFNIHTNTIRKILF